MRMSSIPLGPKRGLRDTFCMAGINCSGPRALIENVFSFVASIFLACLFPLCTLPATDAVPEGPVPSLDSRVGEGGSQQTCSCCWEWSGSLSVRKRVGAWGYGSMGVSLAWVSPILQRNVTRQQLNLAC